MKNSRSSANALACRCSKIWEAAALVDLAPFGLPHERTAREAIADGVDLVAFSGDKLLGGPQAGIVVGSASAIARLRANPLLRALRVDKATLAALAATLRAYVTPDALTDIPFYAMLAATPQMLRSRAEALCAAIRREITSISKWNRRIARDACVCGRRVGSGRDVAVDCDRRAPR